jgi:cytochrome oxidase Cu insertion factor (SCO1/SenC/PrrC family)
VAPGKGTLLVVAAAETAQPADLGQIDIARGGSWVRLAGRRTFAVPASPETKELARANLETGRYTQLRIGDALLLADIDVAPGRVETVLVAISGGRPVPEGSLYAGTEAVNLGLAELAHKYTSVGRFNLVDQSGSPFTDVDIRGREMVVAAFHTTCHTTCPLYTGLMGRLKRSLPPSVLLVEVTTDPAHDRPDVLRAYAAQVGVTWTLATGDPTAVAAFWAPFGVALSDQDAHSSTLALVDRWGYVRITYQGVPDVGGALPGPLSAQLNSEGRAEVARGGTWGAPQVLDSLRTLRGIAQRSDPGGGTAPAFRLGTTDGRQVALEDMRGRPVVINFWAVGCPPCRTEMPLLDRLASAHPDLVLLLVDVHDDPGAARRFLADLRVRTPALLDRNSDVAALYGVAGLPTTLFVKPDGVIEGRYVGQLSDSVLAAHINAIQQR